jgi:hypothetical protein
MNRWTRLFAAGLTIAFGDTTESQAPSEPAGLSGYVLSSEERPVAEGSVTARIAGTEVVVPIDSSGRFHLDTRLSGSYDVDISSPGLTAQSMRIVMPPGSPLVLPPVRLTPAVYARVKLVSPRGDPLPAAVAWSSFRVNGTVIDGRAVGPRPNPVREADGSTLVGPLPRGVTMMAVDAPHLARMRLRDVRVTGDTPIIDAGTYVVEPGATLRVLVVDRDGKPIQGHDVFLDDGKIMGPFVIPPAKTDTEGVVRFDRLVPGTYRLRTRGLERCPLWYPMVQRLVKVGRGDVHERVILDLVNVTLRFAFRGTAVSVASVTIKSESSPPVMPSWLRDADPFLAFRFRVFADPGEPACQGDADRSNSFNFVNVPSGDAVVNAMLGSSRWTRKIKVPPHGGEIVVQPSDGIAPLRVIAADDGAPVSGAGVTWQSGGTEVEAASQANGEVLLQAISPGAGRMTVRLPGFRTVARDVAAPPDVLQEIPLERNSTVQWSCRVLDESGKPISGAVVHFLPNDRMEAPIVVTTDANGVARFIEVRLGAARVMVMAPGYAVLVEPVKLTRNREEATIVLGRGYRALVEAPGLAAAGVAIRVRDERGLAMDSLMDATSDRTLGRSGRASIGPLPRGTYTVELHGAPEPLRHEVRVVDRDVRIVVGEGARQNP